MTILLSVDEAKEYAEQVYGTFASNATNYRNSGVNISSVEVVTDEKKIATRQGRITEVIDTLMYVFNYKDSDNQPAGFTIVSADERIPGILGHSSKGNIKDEGLLTTGLTVFLQDLEIYLNKEKEKLNKNNDSLYNALLTELYNTLPEKERDKLFEGTEMRNGRLTDNEVTNRFTYTDTYVYDNASATTHNTIPILLKISTEQGENYNAVNEDNLIAWGQGCPYNETFPTTGFPGGNCNTSYLNGRVYTGCSATAIAMVAAYYRNSLSLSIPASNWAFILSQKQWRNVGFYRYSNDVAYQSLNNTWNNNCTGLANLYRRIFDASSDHPIFTSCNNGTFAPYIGAGLENIGLSYDYNYSGNDHSSQIINSLRQGRPVIQVANSCILTLNLPDPTCFHTWVIDSYTVGRRPYTRTYRVRNNLNGVTNTTVTSGVDEAELLHCNWGWDGSGNGWFRRNVYNLADRRDARNIPNNSSGSDYRNWRITYSNIRL